MLFADVVGFTRYCDRNPPEAVVANLDHLASTFEDITAAHGLEKIKTVGDAFMATANLLDRHADPVMASLRAAFALADAAGSTPAGWQVRSGIHIGPVVAGVVGSRKFSFDLWGDTVNLAHRLSSLGDEPAIHLSATAWARVAGRVSGNSLGRDRRQGQGKRRGCPLPLDRELRGRRGASRLRDGASPAPASRYHARLDLTAAGSARCPRSPVFWPCLRRSP